MAPQITSPSQPIATPNLTAAELLQIEDRARELRADSIRYGAGVVSTWVKARFAALFSFAGARA